MRVISGSAGGLRLVTPSGTETRPTSDRVKEALFSILESAGILPGARVLDIFAGSGALGIEALSRGAAYAVMVDKSRQATVAIKSNLLHTGLTDRATVFCQDIFKSVEGLLKQGDSFDLVMLDPPYAAGIHQKAIEMAASLLKPEGMLVAESSSRLVLPEKINLLRRLSRRVYGDTALELFLLEDNHAS